MQLLGLWLEKTAALDPALRARLIEAGIGAVGGGLLGAGAGALVAGKGRKGRGVLLGGAIGAPLGAAGSLLGSSLYRRGILNDEDWQSRFHSMAHVENAQTGVETWEKAVARAQSEGWKPNEEFAQGFLGKWKDKLKERQSLANDMRSRAQDQVNAATFGGKFDPKFRTRASNDIWDHFFDDPRKNGID